MEALEIGFVITFLGMTTVFVFLTIMVFVMNILAKFIRILDKYYPETVKNHKFTSDAIEIAIAIAYVAQKEKEEL